MLINDAIAYPIAILIAGNKKNPVFLVKLSTVWSHIAYGGGQAMRGWQACHKTMYHSPAAVVG